MRERTITRRGLLRNGGLALAGTTLAACAPKVVKETVVVTQEKVVKEVVKETVVVKEAVEVEKEVTRVIEKAATPVPQEREAVTLVMMMGAAEFPEDERKLFEEKYPPYKLEWIETDMTKMMAMLAAGQQLDVFRNFGINCGNLVLKRIPLDLTDYFEVSDSLKLDDILAVNDYYVIRGRRYGIVKDWSPDYSVHIRKDYFEESGVPVPESTDRITLQTWREWSAKLIRREGDRVVRWGTGWAPIKGLFFYQPTTYATPGSLFSGDNTSLEILGNADNYECAKFMFEWKKDGLLPSAINPTIGGWSGPDFQDGVSASVMYGYWFTGRVKDAEWNQNDNHLMLAAPVWGKGYANPCGAGTGSLISSQTRYPEEAFKLFEYYSGEEPADNRAKMGWGVPALQHLLDLLPREEPWRKRTFDQVMWEIDNSQVFQIAQNPYFDIDAYNTVWGKYEESALKDEITFDQMMEQVEAEVNELIREGMERAGLL